MYRVKIDKVCDDSGAKSEDGHSVTKHGTQVRRVEMGSVRYRVWDSGVWSGNGLCSL